MLKIVAVENEFMSKLQTIVLAAGRGSRMKSDLPKVLHQVCGKPLINHVLDVVKAVRSLKTYVVLGHGIDQVKSCLNTPAIVIEQKKLLGTADAVRSVAKHLVSYNGDVLVLCGDTPLLTPETVLQLIKRHRTSKAACTVLTAVVEHSQGYGRIIRDEKNQVIAIREDKDASPEEKEIAEINVGIYCFKSRQLREYLKKIRLNPLKKEYYLTDIIELLAKAGLKVDALVAADPQEGLGVNTRADLAAAQSVIQKRILDKLMINGVTIVDPWTTYIDADVRIGRDTIIRPCSMIEGNVRIGKSCMIGPFARLRPGTIIDDHVEIGNFTEVSRTQIQSETVMKHFSFLGDAIVGKRVNIGAGTVTANYDGVSKNLTTIGNESFIGSDSILIAPVRIGKRALVGAGSVVTKGNNIPDGCVAVGVPARVIKGR